MFNLRFVLWPLVILGFCVDAAICGYVMINPSHHMAVNPQGIYLVLVPLFAVGFISAFKNRRERSQLLPAVLLGLVSLSGMILIQVLDKTNHLLQYEEWVRRGMP